MGINPQVSNILRKPSDHPDRIRLHDVRPAPPLGLEQEWQTLRDSGTTTLTQPYTLRQAPPDADPRMCSFQIGKLFGENVAITCRKDAEPGDAAMALLWKFGGSCNISMVSKSQPAHTLRYIPGELSFTHSKQAVPACSHFLIDPSGVDVRQTASVARPHATVVLVGTREHEIAQKTALLYHLRPDLNVFGSTPDLPCNTRQLHPSAIGVDAFHRVGNLTAGGSSFLAAPLNARDAMWIHQLTGQITRPGEVLFAPFAAHGVDRGLFTRWRSDPDNRLNDSLVHSVRPNPELLPMELVYPPAAAGDLGLATTRQAIRELGTTAVFGSNGNIGSAITEALGGKVPVIAINRRPGELPFNRLGSPRHPVLERQALQPDDNPKTVFLTASVPWRRCPRTLRVIFDRAALLGDNMQQIIIPQMKALPASTAVVQIITNPSSDLAYAAWLIRPDLAHAISAHVGTDIVRQRAHVSEPNNPDTWFTFGPHSPAQVNVDLAAGTIDEQVPILGKLLTDEAGDRSVTDPTGLSSIVEAARLHRRMPGCYGLPLTRREADALSAFMRDVLDRPITVSEGIAPTLPRDADRNIRWDILGSAAIVPDFADRAFNALAEMEHGRLEVLDRIVEWVSGSSRPEVPNPPTPEWVLDNRDRLRYL